MNKIILSALSLMIFTFISNAQLPLSLGIKGGITSSTFTIDKVESIYYGQESFSYSGSELVEDASNGLNIGLFARLKMKRFFIQPEGNFLVRNGKMNLQIADISANESNDEATVLTEVTQGIKLSTLDIPILIGFQLLDLKVAKLNIFTGPTASIILNEEMTLTPRFATSNNESFEPEGIAINEPFNENFDIENELEKATWNWQAGVGADIGNFYLDVRYEYGINNLSKMEFEQKTNMLIFSAGFKFF